MATEAETKTYALSLYVDYRLGVRGDEPLEQDAAFKRVARIYGYDAAAYARGVAN